MKRRFILFLIVGICVFWGMGCCNSLQKSNHLLFSDSLSTEIKTKIINLGYTQQTVDNFSDIVFSWKNDSEIPLITALQNELEKARQNHRQNKISEARLTRIERDIAERLVSQIRRNFQSDNSIFDLADAVKLHKAQCLSFTQIFYITASAIGLSVKPVNILELDKEGPLPAGAGHTACLLDLPDGKTIMINVVPNGFISRPFVLMDTYEINGNYLKLKKSSNLFGVYRKIQILNIQGLAACVHNNYAGQHNTAGRYHQALQHSSRAIQLYPALAEAWNNRGIAHRNMGNIEQAIYDYTKALELNPHYLEALNNRGLAYAILKKIDLSIADYSRAITLNPFFAEAYNNRGNIYASSGQFAQAIADYTQAIKYNANLSQAYGNRALNYAVLGRQREAQKDLITAARLNPTLKDYVTRVSARYNLGIEKEISAVLATQ